MSRRAASAIFCTILLVIVVAVYAPVGRFQFVRLDDSDMLVDNPLLHPPTARSLAQFWFAPQEQLYTPLTYSLWWCVEWLCHDSAGAGTFHVVKLLLHAGAAALVFSILLRCVGSPLAAFGGAIVFALHPMQVESVAWIAQTNNVLAGVFSLAAIRVWLSFADASGSRRWTWYWLASAFFLLALFSKPIAVVVPLVAAVLDVGILRRPAKRMLLSLIPWFGMAVLFGLITRQVQPAMGAALVHRPLIALDALGFYFRHIFWPSHLTVDYAHSVMRIGLDRQWIINALIPVAIVILLWLSRRTDRQPAVAAAIALAAALPVLGLIPFSQQAVSTVADRYVYLMMFGPALLVAWALRRMASPAAATITVLLAGLLAWLTAVQLQTWRDTSALAAHTLAIDSGSVFGNDMAALQLMHNGQARQAIPLFNKALARDPDYPGLHYDLGNAFSRLEEFDKAIDEYQLAIARGGPQVWRAMNNLGVAYVRIGRSDLAIDQFKRILQMDPQNSSALQNLQILSAGVPSW